MVTNSSLPVLSVLLDYYPGHQRLLSKGAYQALGTASKVEAFKKHNTISRPDFLNYFLMHRAQNPKYATYIDRLKYLDTATGWLVDVLETDGTINCQLGSDGLQEKVGEAVSLSVAGKLFGLTAADWTKIPEQQGAGAHATFDFQRTIVGITAEDAVIQIEAKGTFVSDNTVGQANVRSHASNIKKKKNNISDAGDDYKHPATALYGMIVAIDPVHDAKCWLLDPPPLMFEGDPRDNKVAIRLDYIASLTEMLAPKAKLPAALRESAHSWRDGAGRTSRLEGHPFTVNNYIEAFLANGKIWLAERDVIGQLYVGESGKPFFLGLKGELIRAAIGQDPDTISNLSFEPDVGYQIISAEPMQIDSWKKGEKCRVKLELSTSSSGVVIGLPCEVG
ncbi:hypothetical protein [Pseudomonas weihenstephanensis]|uniref:Uncharacterized protein n=1 Tax=Pseudomonas weihenstephanensis TaxID=1608994 RepID=A0ABS1ZE46_9PSED|nr:hypothetical protein [Pseudomonas weihenstephanensis]MBM1194260.1 hypothetical protein [Pseudomonas weihenstephanensis]